MKDVRRRVAISALFNSTYVVDDLVSGFDNILGLLMELDEVENYCRKRLNIWE